MRVLIAFDKFKDALTAPQACAAAAGALRAKHPDWELDLCPLTDGGEGFVEILTQQPGEPLAVSGPRGISVTAPVGFVSSQVLPAAARERLGVNGTVAVVGMAAASGLALLAPEQRNPWHTTSVGTGQLLAAAAARKPAAILLGIGGSATNDLGFGALATLGLRFIDAFGQVVDPPVPARWHQIVRIEGRVALPPVFIACDVTNPLLGPKGATVTFGPQKGLPPTDVLELETRARRMAELLCDHCERPRTFMTAPGAGAAGGISFGLMVACGAKLIPGFDLVSDWLGLTTRINAADIIITGEGRFDATSLDGKGPGALVARARRVGKVAHVFAGSLGVEADRAHHAITPPGLPLADALPRTAELLAAAVGHTL
ncbi:glycerate kinase [Opitutus sp. GAS368]|jgi:glycerate kinase|uniref:glycerate kinase family protein n=1 Tax=Opitutus sp. GAS368 TaxID=1882749 RepID=UPI00087A560A|nr:glycerate kinase [Opitutus sp. GAS368]SDS09481.1 glycerate kinase [Opitutus sp. GAS368]